MWATPRPLPSRRGLARGSHRVISSTLRSILAMGMDVEVEIAGDCNEIGILAFLDGPDPVPPADIFSADRCCRTDGLQGCHPVFDHGCELDSFFSMIATCTTIMAIMDATGWQAPSPQGDPIVDGTAPTVIAIPWIAPAAKPIKGIARRGHCCRCRRW
jgi:hypothetical protein